MSQRRVSLTKCTNVISFVKSTGVRVTFQALNFKVDFKLATGVEGDINLGAGIIIGLFNFLEDIVCVMHI